MCKLLIQVLTITALLITGLTGCMERQYPNDVVTQTDDSVNARYWQTYISEPIIQANCVTCHQAGGLATDSALEFAHNGQTDYLTRNLEQTQAFMSASPKQITQILLSDSHLTHLPLIDEQQLLTLNLFNQMVLLNAQALPSYLQRAKQFYIENVSATVVQLECVLCHSQPLQNIAGQTSPLYFDFSEQDSSQQFNALMAISYVLSTNNQSQLLDKATGKNHRGGQILPAQSDSAQQISDFIRLIIN